MFCCFAWESKGNISLMLCIMLHEEEMAVSPWYLMIWKLFHLGEYSIFVAALLKESLTRSMSENKVLY